MSEKPELKPCPFCGGEAAELFPGQFTFVHTEWCYFKGQHWLTEPDQLESWNQRADLANQIPRPSEVYDRIQGYIRVIQEKDALLVDLAKPSEWISGPCPTCHTDPEGNGAMISVWLEINRTHEECADCRFLYSANPPCKGHFPGPVCCPRFKPPSPTRETL